MGTRRPNLTGRVDTQGRPIRTADTAAGQRSTAPPPPATKSLVGQKWWDALPDGATLVDRKRYIPHKDETVVVFRTGDGREVHVSPWDDDIVHVDEPGDADGSWRDIPLHFPNGTPDRYADSDTDTGWMIGYTIDIEDADGYTATFNVTDITDGAVIGDQWMDDDGGLLTCNVTVACDTIRSITVP